MRSVTALLLASLLPIWSCSSAGRSDIPERAEMRATETEIEAICRAQEAAWNRGDIQGFMTAGYWSSPDLTFFSGGDVTHGFEPVLARYMKRYKADGAEMGTLEFSELDTLPLAPDAAILRGRWDLEFVSKPKVGGLFTLVFRRTAEGWRIVHDHTSVDAPK